ncbi:hypothetical protein KXV92_007527 [Aspergillus fumigatus]|nr:hypothetical protein KXV92_007527 [Aspergillus fumigatus]
MSHATEPPRHSSDLLAVCNIADPLLHRTCIGVNKSGTSCKNTASKVSRESASHWLEILAMCPTDVFLKSRLPTPTESHDMIGSSEYSSSSYRPGRRAQVDAQADGVAARALPSIPQADNPPTSRLSSIRQYSQAVTPTMSISTVKSALANFTGAVWKPGSTIVPRRLDLPVLTGTNLSISQLGMTLTKASSREDRLFDGFYSTPYTLAARAPDGPVDTTALHPPHEESSGGVAVEATRPSRRSSNRQQRPARVRSVSSTRLVRRSGRVTLRPDYFIVS